MVFSPRPSYCNQRVRPLRRRGRRQEQRVHRHRRWSRHWPDLRWRWRPCRCQLLLCRLNGRDKRQAPHLGREVVHHAVFVLPCDLRHQQLEQFRIEQRFRFQMFDVLTPASRTDCRALPSAPPIGPPIAAPIGPPTANPMLPPAVPPSEAPAISRPTFCISVLPRPAVSCAVGEPTPTCDEKLACSFLSFLMLLLGSARQPMRKGPLLAPRSRARWH